MSYSLNPGYVLDCSKVYGDPERVEITCLACNGFTAERARRPGEEGYISPGTGRRLHIARDQNLEIRVVEGVWVNITNITRSAWIPRDGARTGDGLITDDRPGGWAAVWVLWRQAGSPGPGKIRACHRCGASASTLIGGALRFSSTRTMADALADPGLRSIRNRSEQQGLVVPDWMC